MQACELVGEPGAVDVLEFEERAIACLDNDSSEREFGEPL